MNFTKRNKPIFIIGLITAIVFAAIIVIGQNTDSGVSLTETIQNTFNVEERPIPPLPEPVETPTDEGALIPPAPEEPKPPKVLFPTKEISFTEEGFVPKSLQTVQGQPVRWVNNTERAIVIKELIKLHEEFSEGVVIAPGESYELALYGTKLWTFKELESEKIGRILITPGSN